MWPWQLLKALKCPAAKPLNGIIVLTTHGKDFGIVLVPLSSCSILGFDMPPAIVSKDQGMQ